MSDRPTLYRWNLPDDRTEWLQELIDNEVLEKVEPDYEAATQKLWELALREGVWGGSEIDDDLQQQARQVVEAALGIETNDE